MVRTNGNLHELKWGGWQGKIGRASKNEQEEVAIFVGASRVYDKHERHKIESGRGQGHSKTLARHSKVPLVATRHGVRLSSAGFALSRSMEVRK